METANEETIYKKIVNIFLKNPQVTGTLITLLILVFFGAIIYFPSKIGLNHSADQTPAKDPLKFDLPTSSSQDQGAVQGASTQSEGPEEQAASNSPSQVPVAAPASTSAQTVTTTPTATPAPTAVPTPTTGSGPTATPTPSATPAPTSTPEATPTEPLTPTPTPN
jgi:hypothetical protein